MRGAAVSICAGRKRGLQMRISILAASAMLVAVSVQAEAYLKKGYIQNDQGQKCWYAQAVDPDSTYFHGTMKGTVGIMTFDDARCMAASDANRTMIINVVSRWYSHADAAFRTHPEQLYPGSLAQTRGRCVQSATYPAVGITIDFVVERDASTERQSIVQAIHGSSLQGCTR